MNTSSNKTYAFYTESNPNPNSLKFVTDEMLMPEGVSRDYPDLPSAHEAPLAQALFTQFPYITRVFYMSNFVTVTKQAEVDWYEVKNDIQQFIKDHLEAGKPLLNAQIEALDHEILEDDTDSVAEIKKILDEYIRPAVEMDGGAISFHSFTDGKVKVTLQGSCSGCPSSMVTLKAGIENLLKRMVPEVREVEAVGG